MSATKKPALYLSIHVAVETICYTQLKVKCYPVTWNTETNETDPICPHSEHYSELADIACEWYRFADDTSEHYRYSTLGLHTTTYEPNSQTIKRLAKVMARIERRLAKQQAELGSALDVGEHVRRLAVAIGAKGLIWRPFGQHDGPCTDGTCSRAGLGDGANTIRSLAWSAHKFLEHHYGIKASA